MSTIVERFNKIKSKINQIDKKQTSKIVAISKTFNLEHIMPLIDYGHIHFGKIKYKKLKQNGKK